MNEIYPLVCPVAQAIQYVRIEDKYRQNRPSGFKRTIQACIVVKPQIPAKPKYG
jgi:hypothetical protein